MAKKKQNNIKLSDDEFLACLRECAGIYSRTRRMIIAKYKIDITRQAVRQRALTFPDELQDIDEESTEVALEGLHTLMRSKEEKIKFAACKYYLDNKGKSLGFNADEKQAVPEKIQIEIVRK
jgi:hypothetical protein